MSPTIDPIKLGDVITSQFDLEAKLTGALDSLAQQQLIEAHIARYDGHLSYVVPEFDADAEWLNTSRALTLSGDLSGKVVVLDFFTYCCINCMHIIPDLEAVEEEFPMEKGVAVVGVHSAKFDNEKVLQNVASAVLRYGIRHPILHDPSSTLWSRLEISCWPTLLILGPRGQVLFVLMGEGHRDRLLSYVSIGVGYYSARGQIDARDLPLRPLATDTSATPSLRFPGKLSWHCHQISSTSFNRRLAVSDTGHHRILITSPDGIVQECIGGTQSGFEDGDFQKCRFRSPQGITWRSENTLFVADTENHAIRKIDLRERCVTTVVGTGERGRDLVGGEVGREQAISSPWDVWFWMESALNRILLIAMAGSHQIWAYAVDGAVNLPNGRRLEKGGCQRLFGSGREENRNNRFPHVASFAQPSGLCVVEMSYLNGSTETLLFVADSESSTVRRVNLRSLTVESLVGGGRDPTDLFLFGDEDGSKLNVKLQHPLAVAWCDRLGVLFVADSYNHKIKKIDIKQQTCQTFRCNDGAVAQSAKDQFNEPGGICVNDDGSSLLVADTNNHRIRVINLHNYTVKELPIRFLDEMVSTVTLDDPDKRKALDERRKVSVKKFSHDAMLEPISAAVDGRLNLHLTVTLEAGIKLNVEAPNKWNLYFKTANGTQVTMSSGQLAQSTPSSGHASLALMAEGLPDEAGTTLVLEGSVHVCDDTGCCRVQSVRFQSAITGRSEKLESLLSITHELKLSQK